MTKIIVKLKGEDKGWKKYEPDQPQFMEAGKQYEIVFEPNPFTQHDRRSR